MEKKIIENGCIGVVSPKVSSELCFKYSETTDLKNLIDFVGVKPTIEISDKGEILPKFKKIIVVSGDYVFRNSYGEIRIMKEADFNKNFVVDASRPFVLNDKNKVIVKEVKPKTEKK